MSKARNPDLHGLAPDRATTALLILDMISDFEFEHGAAAFRAALPIARRIAKLRARAAAAGVPVIYVNDNRGRWRADFGALLRHCLQDGVRGAPIARLLAPRRDDYCILKPKHSAFFATVLGTLLEYIGAHRLILTGVSSSQCVLFTANDAYVRDLELLIPRDCVASGSAAQTRLALRFFRQVLHADLAASPRLRLARKSSRKAGFRSGRAAAPRRRAGRQAGRKG